SPNASPTGPTTTSPCSPTSWPASGTASTTAAPAPARRRRPSPGRPLPAPNGPPVHPQAHKKKDVHGNDHTTRCAGSCQARGRLLRKPSSDDAPTDHGGTVGPAARHVRRDPVLHHR